LAKDSRIIKLTVTKEQHDILTEWACGVPLAALIRRLALQEAQGTQRVLRGYSEGTQRTMPDNCAQGTPSTPPVPSQVPLEAGTEVAPKREERKKKIKRSLSSEQQTLGGTAAPPPAEPYVREIISHLNETCKLSAFPADPTIRARINELMAAGYTVDDFKAVHIWANDHWPDRTDSNGQNWRTIMLTPSKLYGDKFADNVARARAHKPARKGLRYV